MHVWWCLVVSGACLAVLMYRGWFDLSWCIWIDIISSAKNWCTDAADTLMLLNQYHDQLADLSIAFFSQINLCHLDQNCAAQTKLFFDKSQVAAVSSSEDIFHFTSDVLRLKSVLIQFVSQSERANYANMRIHCMSNIAFVIPSHSCHLNNWISIQLCIH